MTELLRIEDLRVAFSTRAGTVDALHGVSLSLEKGQTLGLVGESGSGKSVTAYAITRLLDRAGKITGGRILFRGTDVTRVPERDLRALRGAAMSMIFQNPRAALNPIRSVGDQIADAIRAHRDLSKKEARAQALDLLKAVLIRDPETRLDAYPHELSGGMCQRIMIAMAIACEPDLLIADEPTTGLDVTTQKTVMDLLARITADRGMAMVLITHDLGLAAQYCRDIVVMERGRIVESGETRALFSDPQHPYTRRLIAASPTPRSTVEDLARAAQEAGEVLPPIAATPRPAPEPGTPPLLEVRNLIKDYGAPTRAVDDVSFSIPRGGSLGLVGESGSGKSTLSRLICRLIDKTDGDVIFDGEAIGGIPARDFHRAPQRRDIQIVFQDPNDSLNPRFSAFDSIAHPLRTLEGLRDGATLKARVEEAAQRSGLPPELLTRFPHQLSGGQKARVGIARAIALRPRLLVLDEPTAALDVSVQAIILNLLDRLRREDGMAFLFVSHDLNVVRMMCERVVVLRLGKVVEEGSGHSLFANPQSAYTRELLAAIPHFDPAPVPVQA
ncbi:dipeptide ABC transporter ATP-binding protein [Pararoseomonas indoligenes]|uniref:ABC transporter ATP-binding protein n=1 Tax=Roseomonas indoligenes TaxID=2820811 RepID=A0A940MX27_9PROT|nr:ABC transporter ATP-binding protein [Pararoseomonas indoligenes]MBP0493671.1 ABC transporter ATP-binding protein [Pararoseomonas indoligenes]